MELPVTFELMQVRHPVLVDEVMQKLRRGTSKHRNVASDRLTWFYEWSIQVQGYTFAEILQGRLERAREAEDRLSVEDVVQDMVQRTHARIRGKISRWSGYADLAEVPKEIVRIHEEQIRKNRAESATFSALPAAEQRRRFDEAHAQASRMPGFVSLTVPR